MIRLPRILVAATLASLIASSSALAQNASQDTPTIESLRKDPNDAKALNAFFSAKFRSIAMKMRGDAAVVEKEIAALTKDIESLAPTKDDAKQMLARGKSAVKFYEDQLALMKVKIEDLVAKLKANPNDEDSLLKYTRKALDQVSAKMGDDAAAAAKEIDSIKAFLTEVKGKAQAKAGTAIDRSLSTLASLEKRLGADKARNELVGKKAAPLSVETWVNGSPLTDADLKGKVVLLDFWAVWCGPCIATFPHLREWNAKYADKGLVIIGMTRYYNYKWDDEKKQAGRSQDKVSPADEQAMLVKFAEANNLKHRFAIQKGSEFTDFYGVTGIPEAVVIDREGTIRLIKVGSGDANAKAIDELLEKLLGHSGAAGQQ